MKKGMILGVLIGLIFIMISLISIGLISADFTVGNLSHEIETNHYKYQTNQNT